MNMFGQTFAQRSVGPWISAMQGVRRAAIVRPMTLEQLSALAQIVGAGALLASLIFVDCKSARTPNLSA